MSEHGRVRFGNTQIEYQVIRSARRLKTVGIRFDRAEGVIVTAPRGVPTEQIQAIVRKRADWILRRAAEPEPPAPSKGFASCQTLPYLGKPIPLLIEPTDQPSLRLRFERESLRIEAPSAWTEAERQATIEALLTRWYRERALVYVQERVQHWLPRAGDAPRAVFVRDQRWRWGSCSADGTLRFNWRLIMAAPELIDYVVVHELVHLRVKNHSAAYWAEVAKLMPDHKLRRAQLKEVGPSLTL